jgi:hypothetical protein
MLNRKRKHENIIKDLLHMEIKKREKVVNQRSIVLLFVIFYMKKDVKEKMIAAKQTCCGLGATSTRDMHESLGLAFACSANRLPARPNGITRHLGMSVSFNIHILWSWTKNIDR